MLVTSIVRLGKGIGKGKPAPRAFHRSHLDKMKRKEKKEKKEREKKETRRGKATSGTENLGRSL